MISIKSKIWIAIAAVIVIAIALISVYYQDIETVVETSIETGCNVEVVELYGDLYSTDETSDYLQASSIDIVNQIDAADANDEIKAIILSVYSYGGSAVAGEAIAEALKNTKKPTVALIREAGDSAAYLATTGADKIFTSKYSDVGSIGITASYLDNVKYNEKEGYRFNELAAGKYKDTGNSDKPLTEDEKALIMRDLKSNHENFINDVAKNRNLDIEKVRVLADGSTMTGQLAKDNGLIDELGTIYDVKKYLEELIDKNLRLCASSSIEE